MKKLLLISITLSSLFFTACTKDILTGNGSIITQDRNVTNFTKVKIEGSTDVDISQGAAFKVTASDYQNLINSLETVVIGTELTIRYKPNTWVTKSNSKVTIIMPYLNGLEVNGSGGFVVNGTFVTPTVFNARVEGSGDMQINNATIGDVHITIEGSGGIAFANSTCNNAVIKIEGSGDSKAFNLKCNNADVNVSGSGDTEISTATLLKAKINGSGNVYYMGNPTVQTTINGSGKVIKK
jgi:hypothetical protein